MEWRIRVVVRDSPPTPATSGRRAHPCWLRSDCIGETRKVEVGELEPRRHDLRRGPHRFARRVDSVQDEERRFVKRKFLIDLVILPSSIRNVPSRVEPVSSTVR